jgi:hypothetical protein
MNVRSLIARICDTAPELEMVPPVGRILTAQMRMQALILATMNRERAEMCSPDQRALKEFFHMNAKLLAEVAK